MLRDHQSGGNKTLFSVRKHRKSGATVKNYLVLKKNKEKRAFSSRLSGKHVTAPRTARRLWRRTGRLPVICTVRRASSFTPPPHHRPLGVPESHKASECVTSALGVRSVRAEQKLQASTHWHQRVWVIAHHYAGIFFVIVAYFPAIIIITRANINSPVMTKETETFLRKSSPADGLSCQWLRK